jgi:hypothetical protein
MGIQKYRADVAGDPCPNGAVPYYSDWMGGRTLALVRNCPCGEYGARTAYITGEADSFFSIPAAISVRGKRVIGWIGSDESGYQFNPMRKESVR